MSYLTEFSERHHPPIEVVAWLTANQFTDESWRNDINPCFIKGTVCVWATSKESVDGEECVSQFAISRLDDCGQHVDFSVEEQRIFSDWDSCRLEIESILSDGWLPVT